MQSQKRIQHNGKKPKKLSNTSSSWQLFFKKKMLEIWKRYEDNILWNTVAENLFKKKKW